ncbi:MAG: hemerythrin domain-containing protein [Proteobacteria bacterium]|nr:hemerythrin domain-containing protein [Pseudomonadota bacterium]
MRSKTSPPSGADPPWAQLDAGQDGLRRRLPSEAERISSQHRQLGRFYAALRRAVANGSPAAARIAFTRFNDALRAHFTVEDSIFFPALHGLAPSFRGRLEQLAREHDVYRGRLDEWYAELARGQIGAIAADLDAFAAELGEHEQREEALLAEATQARAEGRQPGS